MSEQSLIDRLRDAGRNADVVGADQTDPYTIGLNLSEFRD